MWFTNVWDLVNMENSATIDFFKIPVIYCYNKTVYYFTVVTTAVVFYWKGNYHCAAFL